MAKKESRTIKHQKIGVPAFKTKHDFDGFEVGVPAFKTKHDFDVFEVGVLMGADAAMGAVKLTIGSIIDSVDKIKEDLPDDI